MFKKVISTCICLFLLMGISLANISVASAANSSSKYVDRYWDNYPDYLDNDKAIADEFLADYNNSEAQALVARAIWYMENGYMIYGHSKYWDTGYIDCSNFVSLVYKDFGYKITSASKNYNTVGERVPGVYSRKKSGSSKYELLGVENLKPGDILTFWKDDSDGSGTHIGHVALYMGKINGKPTIIQTKKGRPTAIGIYDDFRYWYGEHLQGARRVLDDDSQYSGKSWEASAPVIPAKYQLPPQRKIVMPEANFMSSNGSDQDIHIPDDSATNNSGNNSDTSNSQDSSSNDNQNQEEESDNNTNDNQSGSISSKYAGRFVSGNSSSSSSFSSSFGSSYSSSFSNSYYTYNSNVGSNDNTETNSPTEVSEDNSKPEETNDNSNSSEETPSQPEDTTPAKPVDETESEEQSPDPGSNSDSSSTSDQLSLYEKYMLLYRSSQSSSYQSGSGSWSSKF